MSLLMRAAEAAYTSLNAVRRQMYRRGILRPARLPRPVVSIGNISAGGAGKTPAVIALANELARRGIRAAVLTRGYGRDTGSPGGIVTADDARRFGDEPVLIRKRTNNLDVIVDANRTNAALQYLRDNNCDLFILDDGFQHLRLARDLDIVIDPFTSTFHRERRSALADADIVIPRRLELRIPESVLGRPAFAFAGLADTSQFFESLRRHGLDIQGTMSFRDHHPYSSDDLARITAAAAHCGAEVIVTTEKDAVKVEHAGIVAIPADFVFDRDVIDRVAALVRK